VREITVIRSKMLADHAFDPTEQTKAIEILLDKRV
jgi:hypothetical protein